MNPSKIRYFALIIVAGLIGYTIGVTKIALDWRNFQPHIEISSKEPPPSLMTLDFTPFWQVLSRIENNYYDKTAINPQKLLNGAIVGMVSGLDDPYTVYLPPKENNDFKQSLAGKFEGIGAELGMKDKQIVVVSPLDGSPAEKAGMKAGDIIIKVDDKPTFGWTIAQAVEKIRGPKGSEVKLVVVHKSEDKSVDIKIVRDTITVNSLTSWTKKVKDVDQISQKSSSLSSHKEDKIAYIRLSQFGDTANKEWTDNAIKLSQKLKEDKSIKGVIFDLRNNPGGYLGDAVYIVSEFIKSGPAVIQEDKNGDRAKSDVSGKGLLTDVPLIVLLNKGSASASEIVAGALHDNNRAKIVGEKSFGKGTIQAADDLGQGAGLHVTVAKWLTPNGTWVHQKGIEPDFVVDLDPKDPSRDTQLEKAIEELVK